MCLLKGQRCRATLLGASFFFFFFTLCGREEKEKRKRWDLYWRAASSEDNYSGSVVCFRFLEQSSEVVKRGLEKK